MNGPSMLLALLDLYRRDPDGTWTETTGTWWEDRDGVVHGRAEHGGPNAVEVTGELASLLRTSLCQRRSCVSVVKNFGDSGARVAEAAQAFAEAARVVDEAAAAAQRSPYRLFVESRKQVDRLEKILDQKAKSFAVVAGLDRVVEDLRTELAAIIEDARRYISTDTNRQRLRHEAVQMLLWGPTGPGVGLQSRMVGAIDEGNEALYLDLGVISSREEIEKLAADVHRLRPALISQLTGITLGGTRTVDVAGCVSTGTDTETSTGASTDSRHSGARATELNTTTDLNDVATQRWRTVAAAELAAALVEIDRLTEIWGRSSGFSALDVRHARQSPQLAKVANLFGRRGSNAQFLPFDLAQAQALLGESASAYRSIDEVILAFGDPLPVNSGRARRIVVVPTVIAAALTQVAEGARVELGQLPLPASTIAKIDTADALLEDGGIYESLQVAWEAASRICA